MASAFLSFLLLLSLLPPELVLRLLLSSLPFLLLLRLSSGIDVLEFTEDDLDGPEDLDEALLASLLDLTEDAEADLELVPDDDRVLERGAALVRGESFLDFLICLSVGFWLKLTRKERVR